MDSVLKSDTGEPTPLLRQLCRYLSERSAQPMVAVERTTHVVIYLNPAFARLVERTGADLVGRPFAQAVPEGDGNGCLGLLDRVFRSGIAENLAEQPTARRRPPTGRTRRGRSSTPHNSARSS